MLAVSQHRLLKGGFCRVGFPSQGVGILPCLNHDPGHLGGFGSVCRFAQ